MLKDGKWVLIYESPEAKYPRIDSPVWVIETQGEVWYLDHAHAPFSILTAVARGALCDRAIGHSLDRNLALPNKIALEKGEFPPTGPRHDFPGSTT